ncbi:MAG: hypothetical protein KIS67_18445 [Verrucomicrobiae bacterium]|nr:hypothetical protein [Verrucomicrobiae bacterium]
MNPNTRTMRWRRPKALYWLILPAALILLGGSLWAAAVVPERLGFQVRHHWYERGCVAVRQLVSLATYLLTPEDDFEQDSEPAEPASTIPLPQNGQGTN